ncbi:MAG: PadR family transcriptional regulator [Endozoicomonas sp.]
MSPGMLYPLLRRMEEDGLIPKETRLIDGRQRKYYGITTLGKEVSAEANGKITELAVKINN